MATEWIEPLTAPLNQFVNSVILFFPNLVAAVILIAIGWVIGAIVGRVAKELLIKFKVDQHISKRGKMLKVSSIFPLIFEWVIYLVFIQAAVEALGIAAVSTFIQMILGFIPGVVEAVIVVIVGYIFAEYVKEEVEKSKMPHSDLMSKVLFWLVVYVAIALALPQVGIDATLVNNILLIVVGSVCLGFAIAIGLGAKDSVRDMLKTKTGRFSKRK